jgi:hypothetical protein
MLRDAIAESAAFAAVVRTTGFRPRPGVIVGIIPYTSPEQTLHAIVHQEPTPCPRTFPHPAHPGREGVGTVSRRAVRIGARNGGGPAAPDPAAAGESSS